jgi:hypothetical protein
VERDSGERERERERERFDGTIRQRFRRERGYPVRRTKEREEERERERRVCGEDICCFEFVFLLIS